MRKKVWLIAVMIAAVLSGCGAKPSAEQGAENASEAATETKEQNENNADEKADKDTAKDETQEAETDKPEENEYADPDAAEDPDSVYLKLTSGTNCKFNSDWDIISYIRYPKLEISENTDSFDALQKSFDSYNSFAQSNMEDVLDEITGYAESDAQQGRDVAGAAAYSCTMNDYVMRSDRNIVSILEYTYYYAGGAHPMTSFGCANYDPETGERLHIQDVVNDVDTLDEKLALAIDEKYGENLGGNLLDGELADTISRMISPMEVNGGIDVFTGKEVANDDSQLPFTIDSNGITFWFSPYSIAVYAAGSQTVTFPFDEYPDLVKSRYVLKADEYIEPLVPGEAYDIETDDGTSEIIFYTAANDYCESIVTICVDGTDYTYDDMGMVSDPYLYHVKTKDKSYLYLVYDAEDAYGAIACIDPSKITGELSDMHFADAWPTGRALTDNGHMTLIRRCDFLSTYFTRSNYAVGENGLPVSLDKWDSIDSVSYDDKETELTLKCELDVTVVDESGNETGTKTLKTGDKLTFLRTDCENWVDMKDESGDICRIRPVYDFEGNGPWETVDGKDINDIFDGMMFAG